MADNQWIALIGVALGSFATFMSSWATLRSKERSDEYVRRQERQFRIEDQEQEKRRGLEEAIAAEDKYWFDKSLRFTVLQSRIFRARGRDESIKALEDFEAFLEETPEYLFGDNLDFLYFYCNSGFRARHLTDEEDSVLLKEFAKSLIHFRIPTGADIRERRTGTT